MDLYGIPITAYVRLRKLQYSIKEEKMSLSDAMQKMIFTILGNSFEKMTEQGD